MSATIMAGDKAYNRNGLMMMMMMIMIKVGLFGQLGL